MGDRAEYVSFSKELTFETMSNSLVQYFLGAVTLACVAGVLFGGITYIGLKVFKRKRSKV